MKKKLLISLLVLLILLAAAIFALPLGLGYLVQNRYTNMLDLLAESGNMEITLLSYQRHWYNSSAIVRVQSNKPTVLNLQEWLGQQPTRPFVFLIVQNIEHGPILRVVSGGKTHWLFGQALIKTQTNPSLGLIDSLTLLRLTGSLLSNVSSPELTYSTPQNDMLFNIKGFTALLNVSADLKHVQTQFNIPHLDLVTPKFQQHLTGFSGQYNLTKDGHGLFFGEKTNSIHDIIWIDTKNQFRVEIEGLSVQAKSKASADTVNYKLKANLNNVVVNNTPYGEQQLELSANHIDIPTLLSLTQEFNKSQKTPGFSSDQFIRYQQLLTQLVSKGLEIQVNRLQLNTALGHPQLTAQFLWEPAQTTPENTPNTTSLLDNLHAQAHIILPVLFLQHALKTTLQNLSPVNLKLLNVTASQNTDQGIQAIINDWVQKKWLTPKDNSYEINLEYKNKTLNINNQPMSEGGLAR